MGTLLLHISWFIGGLLSFDVFEPVQMTLRVQDAQLS